MRTLDLSYNEINDLSEPDIFDPPKNLTNLYLSHNRLTHVPLNKILPLAKLKILDVKSNSIGVFNDMFMKIIENSTKVQYNGKERVAKHRYLLTQRDRESKMLNTILSIIIFNNRQRR